MTAQIRPGRAADVAGIAAIYGHAVRESVATFDLTDPPSAYWEQRLASREPGDHVLVLADGGRVGGFAYSSAFRPRPGYARTRETSVYLAPDVTGHGHGTALYTALLDALRTDGMHVAVAVVAQPNPASVALHERLGFRLVGTLTGVGHKFGRWIDTRWYQLEFTH